MRVSGLVAVLVLSGSPVLAQKPTIRAVSIRFSDFFIVGDNLAPAVSVTLGGLPTPPYDTQPQLLSAKMPQGFLANPRTYVLRVTTPSGTAQFSVTIPKTGVQGAMGTKGPKGPAGPAGPPGWTGPGGASGADGSETGIAIDATGQIVGRIVRMQSITSAQISLKVNDGLAVLADLEPNRIRGQASLRFASPDCSGQSWIAAGSQGQGPLAPPASSDAPDGMLYVGNVFGTIFSITAHSQWTYDPVAKTSTCKAISVPAGDYFAAYPMMDLTQFPPPFTVMVR